ncbi:ABC transporter ATP-binding protein [Christensenellaceae bacterium OttesenSCG-928-M15]|nr:ABC transporter ATP-binding protein [Christensenellaceae bacterium OttesenSCG-928-M15]
MAENILEITGLTKQFGGLTAVDNFNFAMPKGEIYGMIGPNGAGKTTVFNLITGIIPPTSGTVVFNGENITNKEPHVIANLGIARTFQNIKLFNALSVFQNIMTVAQAQANYTIWEGLIRFGRCAKQERAMREFTNELLEKLDLTKYADMTASNLAYGLQRRVEIARALALRPKLLILDEPAAGMNEDESIELDNMIVRLRNDFDLSVLVIDHHMDLMMNLCKKITVLNFGKFVAFGTPDEIKGNEEVITAYLGVDEDD